MNNKDDSEMKNPLLNDENLLSEKFSRRSFMKGLAMGTAAVSLSTILPSAVMAEPGEESANASLAAFGGSGIYIDGGDVNMDGQVYELEFTQPVKLVAKINGVVQKEGVWRTDNKHLVSLNHESDSLTFFTVDMDKGTMVMNGPELNVTRPNCIIFHKLDD